MRGGDGVCPGGVGGVPILEVECQKLKKKKEGGAGGGRGDRKGKTNKWELHS